LPEFDEVVTVDTWSTVVQFAPGDQFIVTLSGADAATNSRCRVSVELNDD